MRAVSSDFDQGEAYALPPNSANAPHGETCANCGEVASNGAHCLECIGQECGVCGFPIYHDENRTNDAHGLRHSRCAGEAQPRPVEMVRRKRMMHTVATSARKAKRR